MDAARKQVIIDAVKRSATDPAFFLRFFLNHWFPSPLPPFHLGILALNHNKVEFLNDYPEAHDFLLNEFMYEADPRNPNGERVPVFERGDDGKIYFRVYDNLNYIIPRGFSKTTLCKGSVIYDSCTDGTSFSCFISASAEHAETQVNDIKGEFEGNELLRIGYGNQVPTRSEFETWTGRKLMLRNGAIIISRGRGGQIRGITESGRRPNLFICDDIEDEESVATSAQRKKTDDWFYGSVVPAGQIMEGARGEEWAQKPLRIINLGTLLGTECLVQTLAKDIEFGTIRFGAKLPDGQMLWPYKMGNQLYNRMRNRWKLNGKLNQFVKEYDSLIRVDEDAVFPAIFIYRYNSRDAFIAVAQALDPAISEDRRADDAALMVVGRLHNNGGLTVLDEWGGIGKSPSEKIDKMFEFWRKWDTTHNGVEAIQYQAALLNILRDEMARRGEFFDVTPIRQQKKEKLARIEGMLGPRYKLGYLAHLRPMLKLESCLLDWPNGKRDYPDAVTMCCQLLGETAGTLLPVEMKQPTQLPPTPPLASDLIVSGHLIHNARRLPGKNPRYGIRT